MPSAGTSTPAPASRADAAAAVPYVACASGPSTDGARAGRAGRAARGEAGHGAPAAGRGGLERVENEDDGASAVATRSRGGMRGGMAGLGFVAGAGADCAASGVWGGGRGPAVFTGLARRRGGGTGDAVPPAGRGGGAGAAILLGGGGFGFGAAVALPSSSSSARWPVPAPAMLALNGVVAERGAPKLRDSGVLWSGAAAPPSP